METTNFFEKLPRETRDKLQSEINITENEEFISWMTEVPREILTDHFDIPEWLIEEIIESELYLRCKSNTSNHRFGYIPDSDNSDNNDRQNYIPE